MKLLSYFDWTSNSNLDSSAQNQRHENDKAWLYSSTFFLSEPFKSPSYTSTYWNSTFKCLFYVQFILSRNKVSKYRQTVMLYMYSFQQYLSWINALYINFVFLNGVHSYIDKMGSSYPFFSFLTNDKQSDNYNLILISSSNNTWLNYVQYKPFIQMKTRILNLLQYG